MSLLHFESVTLCTYLARPARLQWLDDELCADATVQAAKPAAFDFAALRGTAAVYVKEIVRACRMKQRWQLQCGR